ncbi:LCP family glycopolymer transferase [Jeotgalibacillus terrae]|uniref:LCP family protein n=1 Tax=Jeotgalibacillus terrae TaxID=587735 RepID=A0ABW5ZCU5_9BACL|nr:LCP family protein [Jeotgalibacillus terrae]MBM7579079.1 hypothetical protein [Jeotgalibacillus terrae]
MKERKGIGKDHQLEFTEKDQGEVFEKLRNHHTKSKYSPGKALPLIAALLFVMVGAVLILPMLLEENPQVPSAGKEENETNEVFIPDSENNEVSDLPDDRTFTLLSLVRNSSQTSRIEYGIVMVFNTETKVMTYTSIPRDAYVPVQRNDQEEPEADKFTNAALSSGIDGAAKTVENLLGINIDETVWVDEIQLQESLKSYVTDYRILPIYTDDGKRDPEEREELRLEVLQPLIESRHYKDNPQTIKHDLNVPFDTAEIIAANRSAQFVNVMKGAVAQQMEDGMNYEVLSEDQLSQQKEKLTEHLFKDEGIFAFEVMYPEQSFFENQKYYMVSRLEWTGAQVVEINSVEITDETGNKLDDEGLDWSLYGLDGEEGFGLMEDEPEGMIKIEDFPIGARTRVAFEFELDGETTTEDRWFKINYTYNGEEQEQIVSWNFLNRIR